MAENSKIQWTTHTFNPWRGCTKVHAGCTNCYAEALSGRNPSTLGVWGKDGTRVVAAEATWREPLKWDRLAAKAGERHRVFCASLADIFEDWQGPILNSTGVQVFKAYDTAKPRETWYPMTLDDVRARLLKLIDATPNLDWMLLTKWPENVRRMWSVVPWLRANEVGSARVRPNVWLGTSISDQATADKWIPELLKLRDLTPVLFVSAEPLIGPVELTQLNGADKWKVDSLRGEWSKFHDGGVDHPSASEEHDGGPRIDLVIVGGESGHGARPCNVEWIRSIVKQCKTAGVSCFVKQLGSEAVRDGAWRERYAFEGGGKYREQTSIRLTDKKGGNPDEWPADLRVRQMPATEARS